MWSCFRHLKASPIYSHHVLLMLLIVHLIIGHRRLRDIDYYRDDEMVKRLLGLKRLPDTSTISRSIGSADKVSVEKVRVVSRNLVIELLSREGLARVTLDFDGSGLSTGRHAEGTAVGFNKKKKGARSYYPLFFKVIVTNKSGSPRRIVAFHEGRGSQEGIFTKLKSDYQMDYIPVTTRAGNQLYMFADILAHNLTRELQMRLTPRARGTTAKRAALWCFREMETLRRTLIQRAGRIIRPAGKWILSMNAIEKYENEQLYSLNLLKTLGS